MDPIVLRPRTAYEIVDASIEVYRRNPTQFMLVTAAIAVPWLLLQVLLLGNSQPLEHVGLGLLIGMGNIVSQQFAAAIIVQLASDLYLGRETDAWLSVQRVGNRLFAAFIASICQSIVIAFGLIMFLFPAVYFSALYFAVIPVVVIERTGVAAAFERSGKLSQDLKLHIVGALGMLVAIRLGIGMGVGLLVLLIHQVMLQHVVVALVAVIIGPLTGIIEAMLYYDARIRREGFDIEMMAGTAGSANAQVATA
jgi:hypothetical protein